LLAVIDSQEKSQISSKSILDFDAPLIFDSKYSLEPLYDLQQPHAQHILALFGRFSLICSGTPQMTVDLIVFNNF
jgi:hypothetical protein